MDRTRKLALTLVALGSAQSAWAVERIFLDGFDAPTAFRETDQDLRDPHLFLNGLGCNDITETVNTNLQTSIQTDGADADSYLDASYMHLLQPLDTVDGGVGEHDSLSANCTAPMASTSCSADGSANYASVYTTQTTGTCLGPVAGSVVHIYPTAITNATAPCFVTAASTVILNLQGTPVTLYDARIAATWSGSPTNQLSNGLMRGFVTEADANNTVVTIPVFGDRPLSALLAGGTDSCQSAWSDKDVNNGVSGWWFYVNFSAAKVPYTP
jgi:hypothetical protein